MGENPPVIYLLHGEDEISIAQYLSNLVSKLGDPLIIEMNTTRLDGRVVSLDEVDTACSTMPFMAKRRIVILSHPQARLTSPASRTKFLALLDRIPPSAGLLLVENQILTEEKEKKKGKYHWLEKWALEAGDRVLVRAFPVPQGAGLTRRVQEMAKEAGGEIETDAAEHLVSLVGDNLLSLRQEVDKLVAYKNYNHRLVEESDVDLLTADQGSGNVFTLVDAIGNRNHRVALEMLHRLLDEQDPLSIFSMIVRQFRLILLAREIVEEGGQANEVSQRLKLQRFVADKITAQARQFPLPILADIYHRLLDLDEGMKSGEVDDPVAMDTLIAGISR